MTEEAKFCVKSCRDWYQAFANYGQGEKRPVKELLTTADLIESLSEQLEQVTRERDAAVEDLKLIVGGDFRCVICGHYAYDEDDEPRICTECDVETYSNWQWRGVR